MDVRVRTRPTQASPIAMRLPVQLEFKASATAHSAPQQRRKVTASAFWSHGEKIEVAVLKARIFASAPLSRNYRRSAIVSLEQKAEERVAGRRNPRCSALRRRPAPNPCLRQKPRQQVQPPIVEVQGSCPIPHCRPIDGLGTCCSSSARCQQRRPAGKEPRFIGRQRSGTSNSDRAGIRLEGVTRAFWVPFFDPPPEGLLPGEPVSRALLAVRTFWHFLPLGWLACAFLCSTP